jgi:hypothetical protein
VTYPKRIGFLSFGAWHPRGGLTHTGGEELHQTVELAVAAEEIGIDGHSSVSTISPASSPRRSRSSPRSASRSAGSKSALA